MAPGLNLNLAADWDVLSTDLGTLGAPGLFHHRRSLPGSSCRAPAAGLHCCAQRPLAVRAASDRWSAALWVRNLAEEEYRTSVIDLQASFS